jgi:hypothetical protein
MSEGLLTFAAFGAGMTVIGLYLVCLYLVADALLDRLANKNNHEFEQTSALA